MDYSLRASSSGLRPSFCPRGGTIGIPVKFTGSRSLQISGIDPVSGISVHVTNPNGHMTKEPAGDASEGLGNGGSNLLDSIRGRSKKPWWSPIFKFSESHDSQSGSDSDGDGRVTAVGEGNVKVRRVTVFTDEKARALRRELRATESWHDLMYHSAIASHMAIPDDDSVSYEY